MSLKIRAVNNRLLIRLSSHDFDLLGPMEPVDLALRMPLEAANTPIEFVYFLESGMASVVADVPGKGAIEVGVVGTEGMTGTALVHGDTQTPFDTYMQCAGSGLRVSAGQLTSAMSKSAKLRELVSLYARAFDIQIAATAFSNGRSKLEERLARWLLMVGDRMGASFNITHEFIAIMLGVRRSGVTLALQILEGSGLIRSSRGVIVIVDRDGLIETANGAYGMPEKEYVRLLG